MILSGENAHNEFKGWNYGRKNSITAALTGDVLSIMDSHPKQVSIFMDEPARRY